MIDPISVSRRNSGFSKHATSSATCPVTRPRSLATGRRYAIAIVVDDLRATYAGAFLRGAMNRARRERYAVLVTELATDQHSAIEHLRTLANERVDAVIFATPITEEVARSTFENIAERPLITAAPLEQMPADVLAPDFMEAGRLAARYLLAQGANQLGYVHEPGSQAAEQRRSGFY